MPAASDTVMDAAIKQLVQPWELTNGPNIAPISISSRDVIGKDASKLSLMRPISVARPVKRRSESDTSPEIRRADQRQCPGNGAVIEAAAVEPALVRSADARPDKGAVRRRRSAPDTLNEAIIVCKFRLGRTLSRQTVSADNPTSYYTGCHSTMYNTRVSVTNLN